MRVAVIGTGFIGGTLGRALANAGHEVVFGSRSPADDQVAAGSSASVAGIPQAIDGADAVIVAIPAGAVAELVASVGGALDGRLVIDVTNRMGEATSNSRAALPGSVRYARAFNTLGGENLADPDFGGVKADMFFSAEEGDRGAVETLIEGVGLRPIYLGPDQEAQVDSLFKLWIELAITQGRGRRLALHLLEG